MLAFRFPSCDCERSNATRSCRKCCCPINSRTHLLAAFELHFELVTTGVEHPADILEDVLVSYSNVFVLLQGWIGKIGPQPACDPLGCFIFCQRYHILTVRQVWLLTCKAVCIGKGNQTWSFCFNREYGAQPIVVDKNGVEVRAASVDCAVSICEVDDKQEWVCHGRTKGGPASIHVLSCIKLKNLTNWQQHMHLKAIRCMPLKTRMRGEQCAQSLSKLETPDRAWILRSAMLVASPRCMWDCHVNTCPPRGHDSALKTRSSPVSIGAATLVSLHQYIRPMLFTLDIDMS